MLAGEGKVSPLVLVYHHHESGEKQHFLARTCALPQMLPCVWLRTGWPEKSTREPFALLETAVRVVSPATSFVSFCLSTALPVLGTVSRFLPAYLRCAAPLGQPGRDFHKRQQFDKQV